MVFKLHWNAFREILSKIKTPIIGIVAVAGTIILEAIVDDLFVCPCVTKAQAMMACGNHNNVNESTVKFCLTNDTLCYCLLLIITPVILLIMLSYSAAFTWGIYVLNWSPPSPPENPESSPAKIKCQCPNGSRECYWRGFLIAVLAPLTWATLMFLEGDYFACLITPLPYKRNNGTCVANEMSEKYKRKQMESKRYGYTIIILLSGITLCALMVLNCCWKPKSFHEQQYERLCQELEDENIEEIFRTKAKEESGILSNKYQNTSLTQMCEAISKLRGKNERPTIEWSPNKDDYAQLFKRFYQKLADKAIEKFIKDKAQEKVDGLLEELQNNFTEMDFEQIVKLRKANEHQIEADIQAKAQNGEDQSKQTSAKRQKKGSSTQQSRV